MMRVVFLIALVLLAGCEKHRENPDFSFPEFNDGGQVEAPPCEDPNIRKTLTPCE